MKLESPILLATSNPHKLEEVRAVWDGGGAIEGLESVDHPLEEPIEDLLSFSGNALRKAYGYARQTGRLCLADDSGLVVPALGGEPGVHSARYAGASGDRDRVDAANNAKLIEKLRKVPETRREARFVCVMVLCEGERTWALTRGAVRGRMILEPRGENGFGYDPLFYLPELGRTTAQLPSEHKNTLSHRGQAARHMLQALRRLGVVG